MVPKFHTVLRIFPIKMKILFRRTIKKLFRVRRKRLIIIVQSRILLVPLRIKLSQVNLLTNLIPVLVIIVVIRRHFRFQWFRNFSGLKRRMIILKLVPV